MNQFSQGQVVVLKSDKSIKGAIIGSVESVPEVRYQVFTNSIGVQFYYASQLELEETESGLEQVTDSRFNAGLTASLICNPSISSLYSLNTAKIDFIPHQFRPVLKFIRSDRPRLLIADGVGVGKTIEAGLIIKELQARRNLDSVLIICPRPLVSERKWEEEMKRFDEDFTPLDGEKLRYCIKETDMEGEWPDKFKKAIVPYSLFDESNVLGCHKGNKGRVGLCNIDPPKFDLVIVDEAHHIRNTATYAYKAVEQFCDAAEAVIFLTATPVQLERDDLYVLLNLLRPDLIIDRNTFYEMAEPNININMASIAIRGQEDNWKEIAHEEILNACKTNWGQRVFKNNPDVLHTLQLLQKDCINRDERVQLISDIENMHTFSNIISRTRRRDIGEFTLRKAISVQVEFTSEQKVLHDAILNIMHDMLSKIHCTDNTKFMMTTIRRQMASCLFGLVPMLKEILYRHVHELVDDDEYTDKILDTDRSAAAIKDRIQEILELAENLSQNNPKLEALMEVIDKKQKEAKTKVIIFSSFKHTLNYLYGKLREKGYRVGMIHGGVVDEERRDLRRRFNPAETSPELGEALDILLFSEVGCEGLDYQFCDCMINYDLPWNPMRVEQRIGRIDRNGQTSESVSIYNFIIPGTVDADIYERCFMRIGVFHSSIGDCEDILGEVTSEIRKVAENFTMTEKERQQKLQQITDNKVRFIKEQESLEERQRDLFGIHVPPSSFDEELRNATNYWLSPNNLHNLVLEYLKCRFDSEKEYFLGEKEIKTLRLSQNARMLLLDDFKANKFPRREINRTWEKWLKSGDQHLQVTFDSICSKENSKAILLSIIHPLVKQAANYLNSRGKVVATLSVKTNKFPAGVYPFAIFQWKLSGEKEDIQMKIVSSNEQLNNILFDLLKQSQNLHTDLEMNLTKWEEVETVHHNMWIKALDQHKKQTEEILLYKESSLNTSHTARIATLTERLKKSNNDTNTFLTEGKIRRAVEDYEMHMKQLQQAKEKADILFELLAYGILFIEPECE